MGRLLVIPVLIYALIHQYYLISAAMVVISAISDLLDGYLARAYGETTKLGMFLDPFADKLLVISVTTYFVIHGFIPMWYLLLLFYRDFSLLSGLIALVSSGREGIVPSKSFGKLSVGLSLSLLFFLCLERRYSFFAPLVASLLWGAALFVVISFVLYSFRWFRLYEGRAG
jgi:CDP-diacylglycerol--glycerol-3-phosphate 3-phosphatidyltransferase